MLTEKFAKRLQEERADVLQSLSHIDERSAQSQRNGGIELGMIDQHPADAATDTELRERDVSEHRMLEERLALIDEALERIAAGTYGRCVVCDREIPEGRLEALPETPYCLEHAVRQTARR